jgi:hypothetical protein
MPPEGTQKHVPGTGPGRPTPSGPDATALVSLSPSAEMPG